MLLSLVRGRARLRSCDHSHVVSLLRQSDRDPIQGCRCSQARSRYPVQAGERCGCCRAEEALCEKAVSAEILQGRESNSVDQRDLRPVLPVRLRCFRHGKVRVLQHANVRIRRRARDGNRLLPGTAIGVCGVLAHSHRCFHENARRLHGFARAVRLLRNRTVLYSLPAGIYGRQARCES